MAKRLLGWLLSSGLLLSACDSANVAPACGPGQVLGTDAARRLRCMSIPQTILPPRGCDRALTSDGFTLTCTSRDQTQEKDLDAIATVLQLNSATDKLTTELDEASNRPAPAAYVGSTMKPTTAYIQSGNLAGLIAAAVLCGDEFGDGAHMCTMDELYQSVAIGALGNTTTISQAWVFMPNGNSPAPNPQLPEHGLADTCDDYTYQLGARNWKGIAVEWGVLPTGEVGFRWHGGNDAYCFDRLPIACCR